MTHVQIRSTDVIRLILQYLKQNNLIQSFQALQKQSKTTLNIVNSNQFIAAIQNSRWQQVLLILNSLTLIQSDLFSLYQLIVDDLIEHDRYQAAEFVIKNFVKKNITLIQNYRERMMRLEYIIQNPYEKILHKRQVTQKRKQDIIKNCLHGLHEDVKSSRLLELLTQAIKFQAQQGMIQPNIRLDLFEGKQKKVQIQQQTIIKSVQRNIHYQADAQIGAMCLSKSQQYLALGGIDGLIQIYNTLEYTLHTGLKFQAQGGALFHDNPVTCLQFNSSDEILASADSKGEIRLWNISNGKLLRKIQASGVSALNWGLQASHLLVGHNDVKLYGIKASLVLKQYNVGVASGFVNNIWASQSKIIVITNLSTVKIFNYSTQQLLFQKNYREPLVSAMPIFVTRGNLVVDKIIVASSKKIYQLQRGGQQSRRFHVEGGELVHANCVGQYLYQIVQNQNGYKMVVMSRHGGKQLSFCMLDGQIKQSCMSRNRNLLVSYDTRHFLSFWRQTN